MQTQNIMFSVPNLPNGNGGGTKATKQVSKDGFGDVMKSNSLQIGQNKGQEKASVQGSQSKESMKDNSIPLVNSKPAKIVSDTGKEVPETEDLPKMTEEVSEDVMNFLEDQLQMSEQDIIDVMQQLGIQLSDLVSQFTNLMQNMNQQPESNPIQQLIMGVHGIEDASAFLTNDMLTTQLAEVTEGLEDILKNQMGLSDEKITQIVQNLVNRPDETNVSQPEVTVPETQPLVAEEPVAKQEIADKPIEIQGDMKLDVKEQVETQHSSQDNQSHAGTEQHNMSENPTAEQSVQLESETSETVENVNATDTTDRTQNIANPMEAFTQKLVKAFEDMGETPVQSKTMANIVEQVVSQVRVRVMPETTNMELTLHPESLGRVNLNVSAREGITTARLTVENQAAKDALESQMITLKETFEQKGLKVDTVEVNVSEFGFQKEHGNANEQNGSKSKQRKFQLDDIDMVDQEQNNVLQDATADENGAINYTA